MEKKNYSPPAEFKLEFTLLNLLIFIHSKMKINNVPDGRRLNKMVAIVYLIFLVVSMRWSRERLKRCSTINIYHIPRISFYYIYISLYIQYTLRTVVLFQIMMKKNHKNQVAPLLRILDPMPICAVKYSKEIGFWPYHTFF